MLKQTINPLTPDSIYKNIAVSTVLFAVSIVLIAVFQIDFWIADQIFDLGIGSWAYRDGYLTETVIHQAGRSFIAVLTLGWASLVLSSYYVKKLYIYRKAFWYVLSSAIVSALLVNLLKARSGLDCPWDIARYSGNKLFHGLFETLPFGQAPGHCFPAGHASAGYAWFGIYYFAKRHFPKFGVVAFCAVLVLGLIFGIAQQFRGAHFISHDIWTAWICWVITSLFALLYFQEDKGSKSSI